MHTFDELMGEYAAHASKEQMVHIGSIRKMFSMLPNSLAFLLRQKGTRNGICMQL